MPLPMVHLGTAEIVGKTLDIRDLPAFYLGSIAPDGIHMLEGGCTPEEKDHSHLGTRTSHDPMAVREFLERLPELPSRDYAVGYAVHILTDLCFVSRVLPDFEARYYADPAPALDRRKAYYSDTDQLDLLLYRTLPGREQIWKELEQAQGPDLPGILPGKAADLWNRRTLSWYESLGEYPHPIRYLTEREMREFLPEAAEYCVDFLKNSLS